jgi:hypothetical protein
MAFGCTLMEDPWLHPTGTRTTGRTFRTGWLPRILPPITREPFEDKILRPNIAIRKQVIRWREMHGLSIPLFAAPAKAQAGTAATQISNHVCGFSKQPLQVFCVNCDKAMCLNCAIDPARCQSHDMRSLASIVSSVRHVHTAWLQLRDGETPSAIADGDGASVFGCECCHRIYYA